MQVSSAVPLPQNRRSAFGTKQGQSNATQKLALMTGSRMWTWYQRSHQSEAVKQIGNIHMLSHISVAFVSTQLRSRYTIK